MSDQCVSETIEEMNDCAKIGDTKGLYNSIQRDPYILHKIEKIPFVHTPLHVAAAQGQTAFAIEILGLLPSLGTKLDPCGLSPLHVALKRRNKTTVLALVKFDKSLVRVRGFEGFTPLHYAAKFYPDLDVLSSFLLDCQESINDSNNRFQSAVHLVVESDAAEAAVLMLNWLIRTTREAVLERKDDISNTALHLAARHGCVEAVRTMVKLAKLNKRNSDGKTPLDIAIDSGNDQVVNILKRARAKSAQHLTPKESSAAYLRSKSNILETSVRGYFIMLKDLTIEMRSIVLIVAVLISTATYQAVLQPPGGLFSGDPASANATTTPAGGTKLLGRRALAVPAPAPEPANFRLSKIGKMVMGVGEYNQFMPTNTVAFTLSMVTIIFVLHGRPYNIILHMCLVFVAYSYLIAMKSISENKYVSRLMFVFSWSLLSSAFSLKMAYYLVMALFEDVLWLPRCGVRWHNISYDRDGKTSCTHGMSLMRKLRRQSKLIQRLNT